MKIFEDVDIPASTKRKHVLTVCDMCGAETNEDCEWRTDKHHYSEVTVSRKHVSSYPEDTSWDVTWYDICPNCFDDKLVPWMEQNGVAANEEDV